jgi:PAS domain S-box-containing protein
MVPHSQNVAYSDSGSEVLWKDSERVFHRGWRLEDEGKRRAVLLVVPAADHPSRSTLDHFSHEYELKDELDGTWAVRPLELVREANRTMLVLEDAGGEPLERLPGVPMEAGRFLHLAIAISLSLGKLHQRGLVHKDIKPANILLNQTTGEARLTGFGIASRFSRERQSPHPPEMIAGTLAYMAPEQTGRMNRSIDSRSDLYALGVTFYQMLTGALPFAATEPMEWVHCHLARRPVPPDERLKEIPGAVSAIVMKLLAKRAEDRYQTARGVERDLGNCLIAWEAQGRIDDFPLGEQDTPDRLLIPEKLYGRQGEVATLLAAFERVVSGGAPELVLVSGYSGVGKSSVVNELQPVLVPPRGLFASGKFDQYKRDIPYATVAQAFQSLIRPLLGKSESELASWRDALREALGPNSGLITDLVPEVKLIIGEPPPVTELPPQDAQRRFQLVFRQFIGVFARPEHPLALFLDDLQWLDAATLDLMEYLLNQSDLRNLFLVGAFRDNEVTPTHPLVRKLEAIRVTGRVGDIQLAPLSAEDLGDLVADSLRCRVQEAALLAGLVHAKTDGNPFFVIQFLHALADEGLVAFDHERTRWSWDLGAIDARRYTDNVVELLVGKLTRLSFNTRDVLRQFACLGNVADVATLSIVLGMPEEQVHAALSEAMRQQLIDPGARSYKFIHDRIQEAAYALIAENARAEAHLTIGRLLWARTPLEKRDEVIFEIVNQLNRGASLITSRDEREQVAELNLIAGKRAKASTAHVSALSYLIAGVANMPDDAWERRPNLVFALELHRAECEFLTGALAEAEERLTMLASRAATIVDQAAIAGLRIDLYTTMSRVDRAVDVCLGYLRCLGVEWSAHPTADEARREYERIWSLLGGRKTEALVDLPIMSEPEALATMDVLTKVAVAAMNVDVNLYGLVMCRMVNLSLEHGNTDASSVAYVCVGAIAGLVFGNYEAGFRFGRLGYDLVERRGFKRFQARTYLDFVVLIIPWTKHLRAERDLYRRAFDAANSVGDLTYATYACHNLNHRLLAIGDPLPDVQREAEHGLEFSQKARFGPVVDVIATQLALIRNLRGFTVSFGSLSDALFDEVEFEGRETPPIVVCWYWVRKLQARFLAGDYAAAADAWLKAQELLWTSPSFFEAAEAYFYGALSRAASCDGASPNDLQQHIQALSAHYRQFAEWAENCPENFESRAAIIGAEIARIENRELDAQRLYEKAIRSARTNEFTHIEALACELAARFYAARGFEDIARLYLGNARGNYLRWGADGKVRQLDELHPQLRYQELARGPAGTIEAPAEQLDLATMVEVSQALSGEMVLEKLIDKLMRAALEHAGAERALLIVPRDDELQIQAEAIVSGENVTVHLRDGFYNTAALPESLVRYGTRTHETVILDDASSQQAFSDPYLLQSRVRSVLSLPLINQGKLTAVLYLENNLAPNVFTPDRVALLNVLASQAAISIENSRLYHDLADREGKIRRLVDANIIGIFIAREGRITEANDAFLRILGYDREDLAWGRVRWADLSPPEWRERDLLTRELLDTTGIVPPFEKEYVRKDGSRVPVLVGATLFKQGGDEGVAFVLDLTERKRAEQALQLQATLDSIPAMAWRARTDGVVEYINKRWLDYTGLSLEQALCWEWLAFALIHPDDAPRLRDAWLQTLASEKPGQAEARMRGSDGSYRWFLIRAEPVRDEAGAVVAWYGTSTDIEDLKTAESALRRSEAELANVRHVQQTLDSIPSAAWRARADGFVEYFNKRWLDYAGVSLDQALGWQWAGLFHPEDLPRVNDIWLQLLASEKPGEIEARMRRHDGSYRWFLARAEPLRDDTGRVVAWYGTNTDIEDRTQALAQLQQMEADFAHMNRVSMMGELAASLSHEILHPIAAARNNARAGMLFLERSPPNLDKAKVALGCVVRDADRAKDIVGRMRDQIKKAPPRKERFDLNEAIDEVIVMVQSTIAKNRIVVRPHLMDGLVPIWGDRVQLQQVLLNLALNAAEAMGSVEEGTRELVISTEQDQTGALVAVRDSGPGIDPAHLDRVFDAFYTTKSSGTGMGLSICRSIIDAHGGKLWAEANEPRGAVFQFTLPAAEEDS